MKNTIKIDKKLKKILIIGANGFLGKNIIQIRNERKIQEQNFFFIAADVKNTNIANSIPFYYINITKTGDTIKKITKISPDVVLLTAAMTNVDENETDKALAIKINTEGPKNVLKACEKTDSQLILMSTDFVFDGISKEGNYNEEDIPNPLSHYGRTKYEAELALINSEIKYLICRTAVLYGWDNEKLNFITWILKKLQHSEKISITTTQINNPTFVRNLAQILLKLIEKNARGIYHTAGNEALNRYEMALKCAEVFNYDKNLIKPVEQFKQIATRPLNAGLDISKLRKFISSELKIYSLDDGLNYMKNHTIK